MTSLVDPILTPWARSKASGRRFFSVISGRCNVPGRPADSSGYVTWVRIHAGLQERETGKERKHEWKWNVRLKLMRARAGGRLRLALVCRPRRTHARTGPVRLRMREPNECGNVGRKCKCQCRKVCDRDWLWASERARATVDGDEWARERESFLRFVVGYWRPRTAAAGSAAALTDWRNASKTTFQCRANCRRRIPQSPPHGRGRVSGRLRRCWNREKCERGISN